MKKTILFLALGVIINSANAQVSFPDVPLVVKTNFSTAYPQAKVLKWEKEENNYEVEFHLVKKEMSASYSADGTLIQTEEEMKPSDLPAGVTDYVTKNLKDKTIKEASKITDAAGHIFYEAEINEEDYIFDSNSNFLRKEKEAPDTDKD